MSASIKPFRLAVLISGGGRTLLNLADCIDRGEVDAEIALVISSRPDVAGVERAQQRGLPVKIVNRKEFQTAEIFSDVVWSYIREAEADLVCMAGFLSLLIIPDDFEGRVINIHPALLPKFGGQGMYGHHVHEAVLAADESESGCTVHIATNEYDRGPIILQRTCPVLAGDDPDALADRVFEQECVAYPEAVRQMIKRLRDQADSGATGI
ncbi:phosphoribosylglycinamide formyltransferase [Planctomycetales bacterium ZRK34]|nr:phosphoribosylglycinamide formyltransferase [Planctomycetales bacterium ZRK34]